MSDLCAILICPISIGNTAISEVRNVSTYGKEAVSDHAAAYLVGNAVNIFKINAEIHTEGEALKALGKESEKKISIVITHADHLGCLVENGLDMISGDGEGILISKGTARVRELAVIIHEVDYGVVHKSVGDPSSYSISKLLAILDSCLEVLAVLLYYSIDVLVIILGKVNKLIYEAAVEYNVEIDAVKQLQEILVREAHDKSVNVIAGRHKRAEYL